MIKVRGVDSHCTRTQVGKWGIRDGVLAITGAAILATCAFIVLTADYSPILAKIYALFDAVAGLLRIGTTG